MRIIFPTMVYCKALRLASLEKRDRRQAQTVRMFKEISNNLHHKLHSLLPELNKINVVSILEALEKFHIPNCKTNRLENSLFYSNSTNKWISNRS